MTSPTSILADAVAGLQDQITALNAQKITFVQAPVVSVNSAAGTFGASVPSPADGSPTTLTGISSPAAFLPATGQTVTLALSGPQVVYQPTGIAAGATIVDSLGPVS